MNISICQSFEDDCLNVICNHCNTIIHKMADVDNFRYNHRFICCGYETSTQCKYPLIAYEKIINNDKKHIDATSNND